MSDHSKKQTPQPGDKFDPLPKTSKSARVEGRAGRHRQFLASGVPATDAPPQPVPAHPPVEKRIKKERRRRIDPTTFEKQYTSDEIEFMNAMQRFKLQTGKSYPSYGEVLRVAHRLGYRKVTSAEPSFPAPDSPEDQTLPGR